MMEIRQQLPNGSMLIARSHSDPPGIDICIVEPDDESDGLGDIVAIVEHDSAGGGVYVRAYVEYHDEPTYSDVYSYDEKGGL